MHLRAYSNLFGYARALRNNPTKAEEILWERLRGNQTGYKFRRQHPMSNYVVDFYCHALKYVIEVDGSIHQEAMNQLEDENRDLNLIAMGCHIQRFTNEQVYGHIEDVMLEIHSRINDIALNLME